MLNIPKNDYKEDTRCDETIVQYICNAFLDGGAWDMYHPFSEGAYRHRDKYVSSGGAFYDDRSGENKKNCFQFTNAEIDRAVQELLNAGYFLYHKYEYGSWDAYFFRKTPSLPPSQRAERVESIPHFI
jgi:coproporphyrinogen III oxidase